jgi:ketosteroid isomerase-like protein
VTTTDKETELLNLEQERCRALSQQDWTALESILSADYTHTHTTARLEDKAAYIESMKKSPRETAREDLKVRVSGDMAVMTGVQANKSERGDVRSRVTQVWTREGGAWKLLLAQNTRIPDA